MSTLVDLHAAVREQIETIDGLTAVDHPGQGLRPPSAWVTLRSWEPDLMGRKGVVTARFDVYVFTAQSTRPQDGYDALIGYADLDGDDSIALAVWDGNDASAGTFNGVAESHAQVVSFDVLGAQQVDQYEMYGGVFAVDVLTKGA